MGPFDNIPDSNSGGDQGGGGGPDILGGLQRFSQGSSGASGLVNFGLSLFGQNAGQARDAAVRDGMNQLGAIMQTNGNDAQRAMLKFVQTPEGHKIMGVPGAFPALIEEFQKGLVPPTPQATPAGPGTLVTQQGHPMNLSQQPGYTPPEQQAITTGEGQTTNITQPGPGGPKQVGQQTQLPGAAQTLDHVLKSYGSHLTVDGLSQLALATQATTPFAQASLAIQGLVQSKQITPQEANIALSGQYSIIQDKEIPGRFYIQDKFHPDSIHMLQLGGLGTNTGPEGNGTLNPNWATGNASNPASLSSTPQRPGAAPPAGMGAGTESGMPQAQPLNTSPQAQATAKKYNAPQESIMADGTIDPVKAWGPGAILPLGAGLPAIIQNRAGIVSRWFDPSNKEASSDLVARAEIAGDSLQALLTMGVGGQNSRLRDQISALLEMSPEHEKWNDPQYATEQLIQMRQTFEGIAGINANNIAQMKMEGIKADNQAMTKYQEQNIAIERVLRFLPSTEALTNMKQAIQDGKVRVPSISSAAGTVGKVTGTAVQSGARVLFGSGGADKWNDDQTDTISKIGKANAKDLAPLAREYPRLNPAIQRAYDARRDELRNAGKPTTPQKSNFAPETPAPTTQQFIQQPSNPAETAANPFERAKQLKRQGSQTPSARVNNAFSQLGM